MAATSPPEGSGPGHDGRPEAHHGDSYDSITGHVDTLLLVDTLEAFGLLDRDVLRGD